jgi:Ala-tRNA(Pro) deacylase
MAVVERLQRLFDERKVRYQTFVHREAFTAQGVAAASHVSGWEVAKVVIARDPQGHHVMAVLPASCRLSVSSLQSAAKLEPLEIAPEEDASKLFPDCEAGAMPPFGNLYDLPVVVDACLGKRPEVVFQAGNHKEAVRMAYGDFEKLASPVVADVCRH